MMQRYKKIVYGFVIICMVFFGVFCSEGMLKDAERAEKQPDTTSTPEVCTPTDTRTVLDVRIDEIISHMTLREKIGQMFFAKNDGRFGPDELSQYPVGGIILFAGDFVGETPDSLREKIQDFQEHTMIPLLIGTDEEGGSVVRVSNYSALASHTFASPRELFESGGYERIRTDTEEKSDLLLSYGINVNFAPVCDLSGNAADFMYKRSFGDDPEKTAEYVKTVVETMRNKKIGTVLKHFPGYGDNGDTHVSQITDTREYQQFVTNDYLPFEAGILAGADCILVSHNIVQALDDANPASLSPTVHREIREVLSFQGVVITDDLMMNGVANGYTVEEAAVQAVKAGNDMLLSTSYRNQMDAVIKAVEDGEIDEKQIDASVTRILKWKYQIGLPIF